MGAMTGIMSEASMVSRMSVLIFFGVPTKPRLPLFRHLTVRRVCGPRFAGNDQIAILARQSDARDLRPD